MCAHVHAQVRTCASGWAHTYKELQQIICQKSSYSLPLKELTFTEKESFSPSVALALKRNLACQVKNNFVKLIRKCFQTFRW